MGECPEHGIFEHETGPVCPVAECGRSLAPSWYCDGAGWNGRASRFCVVRPDEKQVVKTSPCPLTNNQMEYVAVILALKHCAPGCVIRTDSLLVVKQVRKEWKVRDPQLAELCVQVRRLLREKASFLEHVPRELNLAGFVLEKYRGTGARA